MNLNCSFSVIQCFQLTSTAQFLVIHTYFDVVFRSNYNRNIDEVTILVDLLMVMRIKWTGQNTSELCRSEQMKVDIGERRAETTTSASLKTFFFFAKFLLSLGFFLACDDG